LRVTVTGDAACRAAIAPDALKQVLVNLVQNAREAADERGMPVEIVLDVREQPDGVLVTVTDNGPGVPADVRPRIFDPFFTTKSAVDGVGLGLFVAEGLVRSAGGRLSLDETHVDGARFVVALSRGIGVRDASAPAAAARPGEAT
jgi:two-component system C4-dicarboxylate transport sensor histidine kinase DctB